MAQTTTMKATNVAAMMGITVINGNTMTKQVELADLAPEGTAPEAWVAGLISETAQQYGCTIQKPLDLSTATSMFGAVLERVQGLHDMSADEQRLHADKALREFITDMVKANLPKQQTAPAPAPVPAASAAGTTTPTNYAIPTDPIGAKYHGRFQQSLRQLGTDGIEYTWTERKTEKSTKVTMTAVIDGEDTLTIEYDVTHHSKNVTFQSEGKTYALKSEGAFWNCMTGKDDIAKYERKAKTAAPKTPAPTPAPAAPTVVETATPEPIADEPTAIYTPTADEQFYTAIFEGTRITIGLKQLQSGMIAVRNRAVGEDIWSYEEVSLTETLDTLTGIAATPIAAPQDATPAPQDATPAPQDEDVPTSTESAPVSNEPQTAAPATDPAPVAGDTAKTYTQDELDAAVADAVAKALADKQAEFDKILEEKAADYEKRLSRAIASTTKDCDGTYKKLFDEYYENARASLIADQAYALENFARIFGKDKDNSKQTA